MFLEFYKINHVITLVMEGIYLGRTLPSDVFFENQIDLFDFVLSESKGTFCQERSTNYLFVCALVRYGWAVSGGDRYYNIQINTL